MFTNGASDPDAMVVAGAIYVEAISPQFGVAAAAFKVVWDVFISPHDLWE